VVEPAERMRETGNETVRVADAGMSKRGGRNEKGRRSSNQCAWSFPAVVKKNDRRKIAHQRRGPQGRAPHR